MDKPETVTVSTKKDIDEAAFAIQRALGIDLTSAQREAIRAIILATIVSNMNHILRELQEEDDA